MSLEEYAEKHWKSVVLCKDCKHFHDEYGNCPMVSRNWGMMEDGGWNITDKASPEGWCWLGEEK